MFCLFLSSSCIYHAFVGSLGSYHHHDRRIFAFLSCLAPIIPPSDCDALSCGLEPGAWPAGTKTAAVHDTCSPQTPLFASFHPPHSSFHSSPYNYAFLSPLDPIPVHSGQVIPQRASFFTLHLFSMRRRPPALSTLTETPSSVTTGDICPQSRQQKMRGTLQGKVQTR